ncbi:MAG: glycosyltransferase family 2 protein [Clostridia bacterium]|nr:glycosyltransferase family 2 protein [Clostridia bacterium]
MENKLISVIIPIYNVEEYLERSVNSVINQSYKNLEIILVDDGSTDKSGSICDKYASLDSRVKVIHKINGGQASAINVALDSAKGEYIGFSDPDDYINKDFYKNLYELAIKYDTDITECSMIKVKEEEDKRLVYLEEFDIADKDIELFDDVGGLRKLFGDDFAEYLETIVKVNKIYKRYLFDTIRFSEVRIYEEWGTMYKLYCNTKRNLKLHKVQYVYVQRKNSTLGRPFSMERLLMLDGIEYCKDLAKEKNLNDLVLDCYRKYFETIIRFISMIEAPNTIDREGLRKRLIKIFTEKYEECIDFLNNHKEQEDYRQVFDKLYTNYEKALNKENGIE